MTQEIFMEKMKEILESEDAFSMDTPLEDIIEWDSLSFVGFLAMANLHAGKKIEPALVREAQYVKDLFRLLVE